MASNTINYGLRKPAATDVINVDADLNNNYDIIDTQLKVAQDVAAEAQTTVGYTGRIQSQATDIALPADTWTTIISQIQSLAVLPVGPVTLDLWFAASAPVAPSNFIMKMSSGLARDWLVHAWTQGQGGAEGLQSSLGNDFILPDEPLTTPTLYQVRIYASQIDPSSYVKLELFPQGQAATLHNFVCLSTVNALEEL